MMALMDENGLLGRIKRESRWADDIKVANIICSVWKPQHRIRPCKTRL